MVREAFAMSHKYTVMVDDNFHYMDESERYAHGVFDNCESAIQACKAIVDEFLTSHYETGMAAEELYRGYTGFGEDPFISTTDRQCQFSAWSYAKKRCEEICRAGAAK
jgi:hypothetical protein